MPKKIKILHLTFDMRIGGTEQVIKTLVENYDHDIFEMSILCLESPIGPFGKALIEKGVSITAFSRQPGFDWKLIGKIRKHLQQNKIDILHCHQYTPWVYGVLASILTKTKVIFTEHGRFYPDYGTKKRQLINPWLHRITDATTAISEATKEALVIYENLPAEDINVIYNGIAPIDVDLLDVEKLRDKMNISNDTFILGTIARLDPIKNHLMMLDAFKLVLNNKIRAKLIIVGDGEMRSKIEQHIRDLELGDSVILAGYQTNPHPYLALMDVYLLSSFSEGTSMTLLEAMSLSKPCIVTDAGGNPEIITDTKNGFVTMNDNAVEFGKAISTTLSNTDLRKKFSIHAKQTFTEKFSATALFDNFKNIYNEISH